MSFGPTTREDSPPPTSPFYTNAFIDAHYVGCKRAFRRCHPRDVISHAIDIIHFEERPYQLTGEILARAIESCFVEEETTQ